MKTKVQIYGITLVITFFIFNGFINYSCYGSFFLTIVKWQYDEFYIANLDKKSVQKEIIGIKNKKRLPYKGVFIYDSTITLVEAEKIIADLYGLLKDDVIYYNKCKKSSSYIINKTSDIATYMQLKYKIPSSITKAQILLETGRGTSMMFRKSNQLFGRKCFVERRKHWYQYKDVVEKCIAKGIRYQKGTHCSYYRDEHDKANRYNRFINYPNYFETIEDRYNVLWTSYNSEKKCYRYRACFQNTDYEDWAKKLYNGGWATDKRYAHSLINIIESNKLYEDDLQIEELRTLLLNKGGELALQKKLLILEHKIKKLVNDQHDEYKKRID